MINLFNGRSTRKTYWLTTLVMFAIATLLFIIPLVLGAASYMTSGQSEGGSFTDILSTIVYIMGIVFLLATFIVPCVRRLHDLDKSGWWSLTILVPFVGVLAWIGLVIYCGFFSGEKKENKYGPVPI